MTDIRKTYVDGPDGQIHVRVADGSASGVSVGHARTPLVCFHMSPYSGDYYRPFQKAMAVDRLVLCPDTPGYGGSDAPKTPQGMSDYAAAMVAVLDAIALGRVDLLGFHTGTIIAVELAVMVPARVRRLVLPGIPYVDADRRVDVKAAYAAPRPYFDDGSYLAGRWRKGLAARGRQSDARFLAQFAESLRAGAEGINRGFQAVFDYDADDRLPRVTQPVLVPVPDEQLADNSRKAAALIPDADLAEWPDLSGDLFEADAVAVAARVRDFLDA